MCGIFYYFTRDYQKYLDLRDLFNRAFSLIQYRGPDRSVLRFNENMNDSIFEVWGFHRLSIQDTSDRGLQPIQTENAQIICNGEIYNFQDLNTKYSIPVKSGSDTETMLHMINDFGVQNAMEKMTGVYAFVYEQKKENGHFFAGDVIIGRDPIGVRPLFYVCRENEICIASEMKCLVELYSLRDRFYTKRNDDKEDIRVNIFPPGNYLEFNKHLPFGPDTIDFFPYYDFIQSPLPMDRESWYSEDGIRKCIKKYLIDSVQRRLISDRPVGVLISGGLDSSIIASITRRLLPPEQKLYSFSIGLEDSIDVKNAQIVADYLGTDHHIVRFTVEEGIEAIREVIWALETYDITTIRASVPNYLISKYISKNTDVRVILSGEGSDELFGGYLYFHRAPDDDEFRKETARLISELHMFDVLRCDRTTASNGLEVREPFLDRYLLQYVQTLSSRWKRPGEGRIEKHILREAFDDGTWLPHDILWRKKDAFSDACGYDWVPSLKRFIEQEISDFEYLDALQNDLGDPKLVSKESYYYRKVFDSMFGKDQRNILTHYWMPNWCGISTEPSATVLKEHGLNRTIDDMEKTPINAIKEINNEYKTMDMKSNIAGGCL